MALHSIAAGIRRGRGLAGFAAGTLAFMVLVILWGAVVRATSSGAGCGAHWPLCNGDFIPHHPRLATFIEFTHRSMSGICTTLVGTLLVWTLVAKPVGHPARRPAVLSALLLVSEALLGAVLVLGGFVENNTSNMRVLMQSIHFTNTMLLVAALTVTWWRLRSERSSPTAADLRRANSRWVWAAVAATLLTGATGSVAALADTLFPAPSLRAGLAQDFAATAPLLVRMRWLHPAAAAISMILVLVVATRLRGAAGRWLAALAVLQVVVGVGDLLLLTPVSTQILHLLGADLLWIALVAVAADAFPRTAPAAAITHAQRTEPLTTP